MSKTARDLTQEFAQAPLGLIAEIAKHALTSNKEHEFLMKQYQQLKFEAPESAIAMFGENLSGSLRKYGDDFINGEFKEYPPNINFPA